MYQSALLPLQSGAEAGELSSTMIAAMVVGVIVGLLITIGVAYWVYKDASKRENNELRWAIAVGASFFIFFPLGIVVLILYLVLRSDETPPEPRQESTVGSEW